MSSVDLERKTKLIQCEIKQEKPNLNGNLWLYRREKKTKMHTIYDRQRAEDCIRTMSPKHIN